MWAPVSRLREARFGGRKKVGSDHAQREIRMAANAGTPQLGRHRGRGRRKVMSEINVTPMVDVMLVLLIIFMVSAPLLTVGVPIDLPQSQATSLDQDKEPLTLSVNDKGQVFLQNSEIAIADLVPKLKAVAEARGGTEARIYVRGDKKVDYGTVMRVMGRLSGAGFHRVALVTEYEQGS
jgi:biopolymer transport protein TolR